MKKEKYFKLFPNCLLVDGYIKSILYDIGKGDYYRIPKSISALIRKGEKFNYQSLKDSLSETNALIIEEWFLKFEELKLGLFCEKGERHLFSKISLDWSLPYKLINSIIYYKEDSFEKAFNQISSLMCQDLQIRFQSSMSSKSMRFIGMKIDSSNIKSCEFVVRKIGHTNLNFLNSFINSNQRFRRFYFLNSLKNEFIKVGNSIIVFSNQKTFEDCTYIHSDYFVVNTLLFTESQNHNTCLNRKLCIDKDGYIRNCPYMEQHYGHISNTNIEDVVNLPEFQKWWHIKKDEIDVCKDCEFRHMCTDCRAFIKDPENIYSQPAKCTYNPYICKWEGEEGYVPVEECGTYSRETGFVPDKKKIKKLNKQIWVDE